MYIWDNKTSIKFRCISSNLEDYLQSLFNNNNEDEHKNTEGNLVS